MHTTDTHAHDSDLRAYLLTFIALLVLVAVTVGASFLSLGNWAAAVAMAIASIKAGLIVAYFMHLRDSDNLTRAFAASGVIWLAILLVFMVCDYVTRFDVQRMTAGEF